MRRKRRTEDKATRYMCRRIEGSPVPGSSRVLLHSWRHGSYPDRDRSCRRVSPTDRLDGVSSVGHPSLVSSGEVDSEPGTGVGSWVRLRYGGASECRGGRTSQSLFFRLVPPRRRKEGCVGADGGPVPLRRVSVTTEPTRFSLTDTHASRTSGSEESYSDST